MSLVDHPPNTRQFWFRIFSSAMTLKPSAAKFVVTALESAVHCVMDSATTRAWCQRDARSPPRATHGCPCLGLPQMLAGSHPAKKFSASSRWGTHTNVDGGRHPSNGGTHLEPETTTQLRTLPVGPNGTIISLHLFQQSDAALGPSIGTLEQRDDERDISTRDRAWPDRSSTDFAQ